MDGGGATPARSSAPVRWGISDAAVAWMVSLAAAAISQAPFVGEHQRIPRADEALATFVGLVFQAAAAVAVLAIVARSRGRGSLRMDFGVRVHLRDAAWVVVGLVLAGVASAFTSPILEAGDINEKSQDVRRIFDHAHGLELGLLALAFVTIGPIAEEVLFRGALLRGLQRRLSTPWAVFVSASVFALVHVVLDLGTGFAVPALLLLGLVSGWRAVGTGSLSQSIWLHAGFNLLAVLGRLLEV